MGQGQLHPPRISIRANLWISIPIGALVFAIATDNLFLLNYVHVFTAILWTGTDIFMGLVLGPVLRRLSLSSRREVIAWLMPKMIFYMPTVSSVTATAGYFLGLKFGLFNAGPPLSYWVTAVIIIVSIMFVQGLGILLPTNLKVYFELRKDSPDLSKIQRLMRRYIRVVASQAIMQLAIIFIMSGFAMGFPTI